MRDLKQACIYFTLGLLTFIAFGVTEVDANIFAEFEDNGNEPSLNPSTIPSVSKRPSAKPSGNPPSLNPSLNPSTGPSMSHPPSLGPTISHRPTTTTKPSSGPSKSSMPSDAPSRVVDTQLFGPFISILSLLWFLTFASVFCV